MPNSASIDIFYKLKSEKKLNDTQTIQDCFNLFDKNKDNLLDLTEFKAFLKCLFSFNGKPYLIPEDKIEKFFAYFNKNDKKAIDFEEFLNLWKKLVKPSLCPKTAFIIVDVQNDFISGSMSIKNCPAQQEGAEVVPCINKLIETVPFEVIAYSFDWHPKDHCSFIDNVHQRKLSKFSPKIENIKVNDVVIYEGYPDIEQKLWPVHCIQGSYGAELHPDLKVIDEKTDSMNRCLINVYKGVKSDIDSYSAFFDNCKLNETSLNSDLKKHGITEVYVCGLAADVCVAATSNDALDLGYRVIYVEDACRGIIEDDIKNQKRKLSKRNCIIVNSNQVLNMVTGRDRRPELSYLILNIDD